MPDTPIFAVVSPLGPSIRLTPTIWRKIQADHPEFEGRTDYVGQIRTAIEEPNYVVDGWEGALLALRWTDIAPGSPKYLCVVYRALNGDGFVITAFFISRHERLLKRGIAWQKS